MSRKNKYGVDDAKWAMLPQQEKQRYWRAFSRKKLTAETGISEYERYRTYQTGYNQTKRNKARRRETDRVLYWRDPEKSRLKSREKYNRRRSISIVRHDPEMIMREAARAVSPSLPRHIRDDVIGSLVMAVLEGKLLAGQIASAAKSYVTEYHRVHETWRTVSLERPTNSNGFRLGDALGVF